MINYITLIGFLLLIIIGFIIFVRHLFKSQSYKSIWLEYIKEKLL
jgi:preprotein translocase subunit Sss1